MVAGKNWPKRKSLRLKGFDYASPNAVFFVTFRTKGNQPLFTNGNNAERAGEIIIEAKKALSHAVYVYCIMPDHVHILCSPLDSGIPITRLVELVKSKLTRFLWKGGFAGSIFQRSFYDHIVRRDEELREITRYILDNPVRKGLANVWPEYAYCGILDPLPL